MAQTALIQVRVDAELKKEAEDLFNGMGLDTPTAVRVFLKQAIAQKGIPFAITSADEQGELKKWKGLTPSMKKSGDGAGRVRFPSMDQPVHLGADWKWSREKLYDRNK